MTKLKDIEAAVAELGPDELETFSEWFENFQAQRWDDQIETDSAAGKLDQLADLALGELRAGKARGI